MSRKSALSIDEALRRKREGKLVDIFVAVRRRLRWKRRLKLAGVVVLAAMLSVMAIAGAIAIADWMAS